MVVTRWIVNFRRSVKLALLTIGLSLVHQKQWHLVFETPSNIKDTVIINQPNT